MSNVIEMTRGLYDLKEIMEHLTAINSDRDLGVVYVKFPDGTSVAGFDLVRERLSDGSHVFNLQLVGDRP